MFKITENIFIFKNYFRNTTAAAFCLLPIITSSFFLAPAITVRGPVAQIPSRTIRYQDTLYIPVAAIARAYGLTLTEENGTSFVFTSHDCRLELRPGNREAIINGEIVEMSGPANWVGGRLVVPIYMALTILPSRFPPGEMDLLPPPSEGIRIMLDPGHGGIDPGAVGEGGLREKDVVLEITRKVKDLLVIKGYDVFMTRNKDQFISLRKRARMANRRKVDLFVSIHANAAVNHLARGTETFYYATASDPLARALAALENAVLRLEPQGDNGTIRDSSQTGEKNGRLNNSIHAAQAVQKKISKVTSCSDRGIKAAEFYVLKKTQMPSILVETGFLSHSGERELLANSNYRNRMARAIARGISDYLDSRVNQKESVHPE
jgi:N-acetylmuramoyl-L-alanine amidase